MNQRTFQTLPDDHVNARRFYLLIDCTYEINAPQEDCRTHAENSLSLEGFDDRKVILVEFLTGYYLQ